MNKIKISIITVCFNAKDKIVKTIDSVLTQTYGNFEYIIIDGKSTDKTFEIITTTIETFKTANKKNIKLISERDNGITDAFNKGIKNSNGQFLLFLNAGDFLVSKSILENCEKHLQNCTEIYSGHIIKYPNQKIIKSKIRKFGFENEILHPATFIGYQVFEKIGVYDTKFKLAMDFEFWSRAKYYKVRFNLINYSISYFEEGGVSSIEINKVLNENYLARKKYRNGNVIIHIIYLSKLNFLSLKLNIIIKKYL